MKIPYGSVELLILACLLLAAVVGCGRQDATSFANDVRPILDQYCMDCHRTGEKGDLASGFNMETYKDLMEGTRFGSMIIPGDAQGSNMVILMEGRADPSISMPHGEEKQIAEAEILTIRLWIDQGAKNN